MKKFLVLTGGMYIHQFDKKDHANNMVKLLHLQVPSVDLGSFSILEMDVPSPEYNSLINKTIKELKTHNLEQSREKIVELEKLIH